MLDLSNDVVQWIKAFHIISVIAWMAGLLYLPRLFVYHCEAENGSEFSEKLKTRLFTNLKKISSCLKSRTLAAHMLMCKIIIPLNIYNVLSSQNVSR